MRQWNIKIGFEVAGATSAQCNANRVALLDSERTIMRRVIAAGGSVDYVVLDSPLSAFLCDYTVEKANQDIVRYAQMVRQEFPGAKLGFTDPLPLRFKNIISPDYRTVYRSVKTALEISGLRLDFIQADNPYEYAENINRTGYGSWGQVKEVENFVEQELGTQFGLIYNSEEGGNTSNALFYSRTLDMLAKYRDIGGSPTHYIIQSWFPYPSRNLPEDSASDFPFMKVVKEFLL